MSPGPTFDRVYLELKAQVTTGRFAPGEHLEPAALGEELHASITPIRDALHRLVGERVVEAPRNSGFRAPAPTEAELRDLYGWNGAVLGLAARAMGRGPGRGSFSSQAELELEPGALFLAIAAAAGSDEQRAAVANLNDRLGAYRVIEPAVLPGSAAELAQMRDAASAGDAASLRRLIGTYHRRRQRHVPQLLVVARGPKTFGE